MGKLILVIFGIMVGVVQDVFSSSTFSAEAMALHLYFFVGILTGWAIAATMSVDRYLDKVGTIAVWLAALSLLGVLIYTLLPHLVASFPIYEYYHTRHRTALFTNFLISSDGTVIQRNAGIASEPGLFQLVLNLGAVAISRRGIPDTRSLLQFALLGIALFATRSTAGLIIFAVILIYTGLKSGKAFLVITAAIVTLSGVIRSEVDYQFANKLAGTASFEQRLEPAQAVLAQVLSSPLGVGNRSYNEYFKTQDWGSYDSFTQILIRYGLPLTLIIVGCLMARAPGLPLVVIVIVMTMLSQPIWSMPLVTYFYFSRVNEQIGNRSTASKHERVST